MPDPFFAQSASNKRKRSRLTKSTGGKAGKGDRGGKKVKASSKGKGKARRRDGDYDSNDDEDEESDDLGGGGGFDSDPDIPSNGEEVYSDEDAEDDARETPAQKRLRLAKAYLDGLKETQRREEGEADAAQMDRELISARLQQDVRETTGRVHDLVASRLPSPSTFTLFQTGRNHHRLPVTCAVASSDGAYLYAADKSGSIVKYSLSSLWSSPTASSSETAIRKVAVMSRTLPERFSGKDTKKGKAKATGVSQATEAQHGHIGEVFTIAVSGDGKILASGGKDRLIGVWDVSGDGATWRKGLRGHKDTIASLVFRLGTSSLFTSSYDRTLKIFELSSLSYSETLFGHQDKISCIAALRNELAVSAGGRDRTVRYWKVADESQLVFRGGGQSRMRDLLEGAASDDEEDEAARMERRRRRREEKYVEGSMDCVAMVDDQTFLSGGDSGSICLWSTAKKKPVFSFTLAHGVDSPDPFSPEATEVGVVPKARWITALGCLPYGDVFASGSWGGSVRLWKIESDRRSFTSLGEVEVKGCINSLQIVKHMTRLQSGGKTRKTERLGVIIGAGQEPRLGRWMRMKEVRNRVIVATAELGEAAASTGQGPKRNGVVVNGFH